MKIIPITIFVEFCARAKCGDGINILVKFIDFYQFSESGNQDHYQLQRYGS